MNSRIRAFRPVHLIAAAMLLGMSGCVSPFDPLQRPGSWVATGAANETIAQQAANPADLISGQSSPTSSGVAATGAIDKAMGPGGSGSAAGLQSVVSAQSVASSD